MAFSIQCTNKGCYQIQEPYLDPITDKVYCSKCNNEIINVTYFAKVQMKSNKQFKPKTNNSFSIKCSKCGRTERPKISNDDIICSICNAPIENISVPFKNMLKEQLKKIDS